MAMTLLPTAGSSGKNGRVLLHSVRLLRDKSAMSWVYDPVFFEYVANRGTVGYCTPANFGAMECVTDEASNSDNLNMILKILKDISFTVCSTDTQGDPYSYTSELSGTTTVTGSWTALPVGETCTLKAGQYVYCNRLSGYGHCEMQWRK